MLEGFTGEWRGTGAVRTTEDGEPEKLVCRVEGELDDSGDALELSGRCGGERFTGTFRVSLTYNKYAKAYSAVWRDSLGSVSPPLTGLRSGSRLVFRVRHNDFETEGRAISTLIVDPEASRFRIVGRTLPAAGTEDFVSADLIFVKG
ncbi:hypothetical protein [Microbaculum marinum]|uniref:DUF1579 domain-containing protein n=1 Tax=Microbaculum marinum TaxID=1764581 RepID=A0AAW9RQ02_9HYPH